MFLVEPAAESLADDSGLRNAVEELPVQTFVPESSVEALCEAVLPGLSGIDEMRPDALVLQPQADLHGDELRPVVAADELRHAPLADDPRQDFADMQGLEGPTHLDGDGFPGVFVLQGQELQRGSAHRPREDEVVGPDVVGEFGDPRHALARPHLLPWLPSGELKAQLPP